MGDPTRIDGLLGDQSPDGSGADNITLQEAGMLGGKPYTTFVDAGMNEKYDEHAKARDKAIHSYEDDNRTILGHQTDEAKEILNDANRDEVRDQLAPEWRNNHGQGNYRGNLNGKSFQSTLNLSRAADALNNKRWWNPGTLGRTTNSKFGSEASTMGKSERWEPIETQETRQMRQNERVEERVRNRDVDRQADLQDYPLELQKKADEARFNISQALNISDKDVEQALRTAAHDINMRLPAQTRANQMITNFLKEIELYTDTKWGNYLIGVWNKCGPTVTQMLAQTHGGTAPGYQSVLQDKIYEQFYKASGGDPLAARTLGSIVTAGYSTMGNMGLAKYALSGWNL